VARTVKTTPRWWRTALSVLAWWAVLSLTLWLMGKSLGQPTRLAPCAASAALLVTIGETGDWLRRRARARHHGKRPGRSTDAAA
jgi:hypothetical protein